MAVLFMSMHMYLQIFPPTRLTFLGHDGLYRIRKYVYAIWFIVPNLTAALAFANPDGGYMAQGGFCSLPLRPMWYRLALFWIPRYLIWIYVIFVAVSITRYVGSEFKVFGQARDSSTSQPLPTSSTADSDTIDTQKTGKKHSPHKMLSLDDDDLDECAPDDVESVLKAKSDKLYEQESAKLQLATASRRGSLPTWSLGPDSDTASNPFASQSKSTPTSRRGSLQVTNGILSEDFGSQPAHDASAHRGPVVSMGSIRSSAGVSFENSQPPLAPIAENLPSAAPSHLPHHSANKALKFRRAAIQRQLRLLFIYPCIYMILWVVPFVVNCMNYIDYWAQHPIFSLKIVQLTCMTIMTFVDVFVFCWREKPWRHVPGSDGTFLGSFMFWRFCFGGTWAQRRRMSRAPSNVPDLDGSRDEKNASQTGLLARIRRWVGRGRQGSKQSSEGEGEEGATTLGRPKIAHKRQYSGGSDRRHLEAERAAERLAMERAEYEANRRSLNERRTSVVSQSQKPPAGRKDWFDTRVEDDLAEDGGDGTSMSEKRDSH